MTPAGTACGSTICAGSLVKVLYRFLNVQRSAKLHRDYQNGTELQALISSPNAAIQRSRASGQ
jgi:hypothetical protein